MSFHKMAGKMQKLRFQPRRKDHENLHVAIDEYFTYH